MIEGIAFIFLAIWFITMMFLPWMQGYKRLLKSTVLLTASFTLYALLQAEYAAASITAISFLAVFAQLLLPESNSLKSKLMRNGIAIFFSVIAVILLYQKPIDILPCLGSAIIRVSEAQQSPIIMKTGYITGIIMWAIFGYYAELYTMFVMQFLILFSYLAKFAHASKAQRA